MSGPMIGPTRGETIARALAKRCEDVADPLLGKPRALFNELNDAALFLATAG
jgi:hypothetical protein